ncbi:reprolysin-like metallopeptidase [Taibaiella koreensis]|uniref:reprolysin-like metallopeptidase n=1 Tax=Taibaiella koreensis TaxID=1268548 RepID=UPI000E59984B|nr:zinc-dependent metalloprotease family protein [Taibaiella koreensis]
MKKNLFTGLTATLMMLTFAQSYGSDQYWRKFDGKTAPSRLPMAVAPKEYTIFTLNQDGMHQFLFGLGDSYELGRQIQLPDPGNTSRSFRVWKTPAMEQGLADRYPDIQTFTAEAVDDPNVTAKLEWTLFGFTGYVFDGDNAYIIDPYSNAADGYYIVFREKDYTPTGVPSAPCRVGQAFGPSDQGTPVIVGGHDEGKIVARTNGSVKRFYRLAMSCTGEYALSAVGPTATVPQVLSKIITTVNRVNGFYERELSVSMKLVSTNDQVLYVDPTTDPYNCNTALNCLIGEAQNNITNVIGAANFDIGHIVCTAGGGLAQLAAVCGGGKASGTSTSSGPDDIHVILHEMGHQYGSNHTFSAGTGSCSGNGNATTAYEPGAGNSVMSYSGGCTPNNTGSGADYFHVSSFNEINTFLVAQGSTCGERQNALVPVVSLPAVVDSYSIPGNTPFELLAPIATAPYSSERIRYSWEQYDLGNFEGTESANGNATDGPIMRSFAPDTSRLRTYPSMANILSGAYTAAGERLPRVERTVRFKLTARNVFQGWGTFNFIDSVLRLKVAGGASDFRVTSPSSDVSWPPGEKVEVTWSVAGTDADPVKCKEVNIYLSLDNGATFPYQLAANVPNNGSYKVKAPNLKTEAGRVKVKGAGNVFFDVGQGLIAIDGDPNGIEEVQLAESLAFYPNPATDKIHVLTKKQNGNALKAVMYNAVGQRVWDGTIQGRTEINTGGFARGNYLIQVLDEHTGARTTHKVALQ